MKKIIVPIDFSLFSENALRTAAFIAKKYNSELIVVHMLDFPETYINESESFSQERLVFYLKLTEKKLAKYLDKEYLKGVKIATIVKYHKFFNELKDIVSKENADLIIMGSHGVNGIKEIFVGSNAEKVVRNSEVPVLVIKGLPTLEELNKCVFACDFSGEDIVPYQKAKELLKIFDSELDLLYVNAIGSFKSTNEQQKLFENFLNGAEGNVNSLEKIKTFSSYSVEKGILDYSNQNKIDLIIMATHGKKGVQHFLEGSISEDVVNHSNLPVLTIKM